MVDVVTWSTDSVGVQGLVFPDGLVGGGVQHGPHHLVKTVSGGTSIFCIPGTAKNVHRRGERSQLRSNNNTTKTTI